MPHGPVDVQDIDCDFLAFSSHKVFGPTGMGVLYGKAELLDSMPPYQGGGDMIKSVTFEKTIYNDLPYKFEAGTPNIAGAIGLGAAIDYVQEVGMGRILEYESSLLSYAHEALSSIERVRILGTARKKAGVVSFLLDGIHAPRRGNDTGHGGCGYPDGAPLRPAGDAALRSCGDGKGVVGFLQHQV